MNIGYRRLAAEYIGRQAKQLVKQLDGVRAAEDIEFVHRARVATRRLRAALKMFDRCFAPRQIKQWRKAIRRITASLGDARDRDVQIEWLCGTLSALCVKECFPGVAHVLVQLERDREQLQQRVVEAVDSLQSRGILREMRRATRKVLAGSESTPQSAQTPEACKRTEQHIARQLHELLEHQGSLADPDDRERHHAMRIAAKRLRYTLEISHLICPGRLDEALEAIKKVQTMLGDIHDCDVWLDHLDAFAEAERDRIIAMFGHAGRFLHLQPGVEYLQQDRRSYRQETFGKLAEYWTELDRRRFWDVLANAEICGHGT